MCVFFSFLFLVGVFIHKFVGKKPRGRLMSFVLQSSASNSGSSTTLSSTSDIIRHDFRESAAEAAIR